MTDATAPKLGVKDALGSLWFLFVCYSAAAFFDLVPVPQFAKDAWFSISGQKAEMEKFKALTDEMPEPQQRFVLAVMTARNDYRKLENEVAKGATRATRAQQVCAHLKEYTDGYWVGFVDRITANGDGNGVVSIFVAPFTTVSTWNNSLSDVGNDTLIKAGTPLSNSVAQLKEGQKVRFTGKFFKDDVDCVDEKSITLEGSMTNPDYAMKFERIEAHP